MMAALLCLSMAVYHESRSEPLAGQAAVAMVVINRTHDPRYPDDVCSVTTEAEQFAFAWTAPRNSHAWQQAIMIAESALAGDIKDMTNGAVHYSRHDVRPSWAKGMKGQRIGDHVFWTGRDH